MSNYNSESVEIILHHAENVLNDFFEALGCLVENSRVLDLARQYTPHTLNAYGLLFSQFNY